MRAACKALVMVVAVTVAGAARAEPTPGALFAERPLPDGAVAVFGTLGFPSVALGVRQGFGGVELGAVAGFDYSLTQLNLDVPFRFPLAQSKNFILGAGLSVGGFKDFGATYYEDTNLSSAGLRLAASADFTARVHPNFDLFFNVATPIELPLTERGNDRYGFRMGGGAEFGLGDGYTFGAQLLAGADLLHPRGGGSTGRLELSVQTGLGKRFF